MPGSLLSKDHEGPCCKSCIDYEEDSFNPCYEGFCCCKEYNNQKIKEALRKEIKND